MVSTNDTAKIDDITDFDSAGLDVYVDHDANGNVIELDLSTGDDSLFTYGADNRLKKIVEGTTEYEFAPSYLGPPMRIEVGSTSGGT